MIAMLGPFMLSAKLILLDIEYFVNSQNVILNVSYTVRLPSSDIASLKA